MNQKQDLQIISILGQTQMGYTKPFICKASDGRIYIVKTLGLMPYKQLIAEYLGGLIATELGLSIPEFQLMTIKSDIYKLLAPKQKRDLTNTTVFGSLLIENTSLAKFEQVYQALSEEEQKEIYFFDRWINNSDRSSSLLGTGNINLLYDPINAKVYLIDHNLAFSNLEDKRTIDDEFSVHVFSQQHRVWSFNKEDKNKLTLQAKKIIQKLDLFFDLIPFEWQGEDSELFEDYLKHITQILKRIENDEFWEELK